MSTEETQAPLSLKNLIRQTAPEKWIEFRPGVRFKLRYLTRPQLRKITQECMVSKFDKDSKARINQLDSKLLAKAYIENVVVGWDGVTVRFINSELCPLDVAGLSDAQLDAPLEYSASQIEVLLDQAYELDTFIQEASTDPTLFVNEEERAIEVGN
jgi:hypothetical protein